MNTLEQRDFFISYNGADETWAEWIAWQLEDTGYSTVLQAWDFRPGGNFVLEMDQASRKAERTVIVLSKAFLTAFYTQPEWAAAFAGDPEGKARHLIPVRVEPVKPEGLLSQIVYIDLVGKDEEAAKTSLLRGVQGKRTKPVTAPSFPGESTKALPRPLSFPGAQVSVPAQLAPYVEIFRNDHPDPRRVAFLIMPFANSLTHRSIQETISKALAAEGITVVRADDKAYAPDLMTNIRTYMHGCSFGIAVFERLQSQFVNPNVALEVGYMLALGKPVCFLKERTLDRLATDLAGLLYHEFDSNNPDATIRRSLERWLRHLGLIGDSKKDSQQSDALDEE